MGKHTVGPLKFRGTVEGNRLLICDEADSPIGAVYMTNDPDVAQARARVLCAAPALLEALTECLERGGTTSGEWIPRATYDKAQAALKLARGEG